MPCRGPLGSVLGDQHLKGPWSPAKGLPPDDLWSRHSFPPGEACPQTDRLALIANAGDMHPRAQVLSERGA